MTETPRSCTASVTSVLTGSLPVMPLTQAQPQTQVRNTDHGPAAAAGRSSVHVTGVIAEIGIAPVQHNAQFTAVLIVRDTQDPQADGRAIQLLWQGQRSVPGVGVGATLECVGVLCQRAGQATIFNPRYEIVAKKVQR